MHCGAHVKDRLNISQQKRLPASRFVCTGSCQVEVGGGVASVPCANGANTLDAEKVESDRLKLGHSKKQLELKKLELTSYRDCIKFWWAIHLDIL